MPGWETRGQYRTSFKASAAHHVESARRIKAHVCRLRHVYSTPSLTSPLSSTVKNLRFPLLWLNITYFPGMAAPSTFNRALAASISRVSSSHLRSPEGSTLRISRGGIIYVVSSPDQAKCVNVDKKKTY